MQTILNKKLVDPLKQPLFLGEDLGVPRLDKIKYQVFYDLYKKQREFFWSPEEIELKKDRNDFKDDDLMSDNDRFIFTSNLKYQTMLDGVICRGVPTISKYVSNSELFMSLGAWEFFEGIHTYSYSYIIQNVYPNPSEVFDSIYTDKEIMKRADTAIRDYDNLMGMKLSKDLNGLKKQIYMTLISVNILEAVRFYVSFVCAFAFSGKQEDDWQCGYRKTD